MEYKFDKEKFKESFNAKDNETKSADSFRLTHKPDIQFKLYPYKASGKTQAPIVYNLEDVVTGFFREASNKVTEPILFEELNLKYQLALLEDTCFYCGKKLQKVIHVDHFIPWSFVKDDKIWNFVLSCPTCNEKKNNRVPGKDYLIRIEDRNKKIQLLNNTVIQTDFAGYSDDLIGRMWSYAKLSGIKEYRG